MWNIKITVIPIIVGALGIVPKDLEKRLEELKIRGRIDTIQTAILFIENESLGYLRRLVVINCFQTIFFIFIVIFTTFRPICPLAFFRCFSNSGTFMKLWITSFIESMGVACSDSVSHNRVQALSIPVLFLTCSQDWICNLQMVVSLEA